jgi:glycosyltransferase involved in cell wall biosynthesis
MNVIVATTCTPFHRGGAEVLAESLVNELRKRGHTVEFLTFPLDPRYDALLDQMLAFRLLDLTHSGDRLIALRSPSYLLRHPRKVVWFLHHHRAAYDLWQTEYGDIPMTPEGIRYRDAVRQADDVGLREAFRLYANSRITANRLSRFNRLDAQILYPPLPRTELFRCGEFGDYLLFVSRLSRHKRQWLAIEAMAHTRTPARLVIAGPPAPGEEAYASELQTLILERALEDRVVLLPRYIADPEKADLYSNCLAVLYCPFQEDSYGFVTLEAYASAKPVITAADSGGTLELVADGVNGRVLPPDPEEIAHAVDDLWTNPRVAKELGDAGLRSLRALDLSWDVAIDKLLT